MAKNPITIKESKQEFITTRQEFIKNNNRKCGGPGNLIFRKYKTDKERIEDFLRGKD